MWKPLDFLMSVTDFRSGKAPILVATDVAARGLGTLHIVGNTQVYFLFYHLCSIGSVETDASMYSGRSAG